MLICHCHGVNDRTIRTTVNGGAKTVAQVGRSCRAGTCCGGCVRAIAEIVEETGVRSLPVHRTGQVQRSGHEKRVETAPTALPAAASLPIAAE